MREEDGYFDERVAATYDESSADMFDPAVVEPTVDFLAELAEGGRALELGIGTGRIALPLAARGVAVHGIELSKAMAARLRAKPGGEGILVTIGDFATAKADGSFSLAYLVFNRWPLARKPPQRTPRTIARTPPESTPFARGGIGRR
ncbi:MAG TPA: class I SAM-dependent methyltransferase [Candidatus Limnocylindrales bacterium]|jgi:SAM-dependent methyltransferase|nr:class I SAM-dependent methyltransferase [Candidatus Limnocylindrales bacterium]